MRDETRRFLQEHVPSVLATFTEAALQLAGADPMSSALAGKSIELGMALDQVGYRRRAAAAAQALDVAIEEHGNETELVRCLLADDQHTELTMQVLKAASETAYQEKIKALGKTLAAGAKSNRVDHQAVVAGIVADLEVPHVQMLLLMARIEYPDDVRFRDTDPLQRDRERLKITERNPESGPGWTIEAFEELCLTGDIFFSSQPYTMILRPLLATLERHGLVRQVVVAAGSSVRWAVNADVAVHIFALLECEVIDPILLENLEAVCSWLPKHQAYLAEPGCVLDPDELDWILGLFDIVERRMRDLRAGAGIYDDAAFVFELVGTIRGAVLRQTGADAAAVDQPVLPGTEHIR